MHIQQVENEHLIPFYTKRDIALVKGEGVYLYDSDGKKYLDFLSNYGANVLGYGNRNYIQALTKQLGLLTNCHSSFFNDVRARFLAKLHSFLPLSRSFLSSTGTESTEAALKIARLVTKRTKIISAKRAYHGRTMGSLSATAISRYQEPFLPLLPNFVHVPFDNLEELTKELDQDTGAVILEPIQGDGGVNVPKQNYLKQVKDLCVKNGSLLILDEVQTGLRTGNWLASQHFQVIPDILCLAKGLGNGFPVGVTVVSEEISNQIPKGAHGTTFGSNPLACQAALTTIEEIDRLNLHQQVKENGQYIMDQLKSINSHVIREVRGIGLMIGVELKQKAGKFVKQMQDNGLILVSTNNVLRILPPLVINKKEINQGLEILRKVLA